eukprot:s2458_g2.t1
MRFGRLNSTDRIACVVCPTGTDNKTKPKKPEEPSEAVASKSTDGALASILIGVGVTLVFFLGLYCALQMGRRRSQQQDPLMDPQPARPTVRSYRQQRQMQASGATESASASPSSPTPAPAPPEGEPPATTPPPTGTGSAGRGGYGARRNQSQQGAQPAAPPGQELLLHGELGSAVEAASGNWNGERLPVVLEAKGCVVKEFHPAGPSWAGQGALGFGRCKFQWKQRCVWSPVGNLIELQGWRETSKVRRYHNLEVQIELCLKTQDGGWQTWRTWSGKTTRALAWQSS